MADIIVKIAINPSGTGAIGAVSTNNYELLNNISIKTDDTGTFEVLTDDKFQGTEMLAFNKGLLHFNSAGFLSNQKNGEAGRLQSSKKPRQYVWSRTDENGYALGEDNNPVEIVLTLESADPSIGFDSIVIIGDSVAKQFPVEAYLDNSTQPIYSDDAKWAIKFDESKMSHTIRLTRWNRPNYNAVLSSIRVMYKYINIGNSALQSISSIAQTTSDVSTINYGVIANSGSIEMIDGNGEIEDLIRDKILPNSDVELEVQYNGETVQHHITNDTDYKSDTKEFNLSLTNKVKDLDILKYKGYAYPDESRSLYDILFDVMKSLSGGVLKENDFKTMTSNKCFASSKNGDAYLDEEMIIYDYLKSIIIQYPVIEAGKTYREVIDNICTVAQLRMFVNDDNKYEFVSAKPLMFSTDNPLVVELRDIMTEPVFDVIVKNKFNAVEINEKKVVDEVVYDKFLGEFQITDLTSISNKNMPSENEIANELTTGSYNFGKSYLMVTGCMSYVKVGNIYYDGEITIQAKSNYNLNQIQKIYEDFGYTINYTKKVNNCRATKISYDNDSFSKELTEGFVIQGSIESTKNAGQYDTSLSYTVESDTTVGLSATATTSIDDNSKISIVYDGLNFKVSYHILICQYQIKMGADSFSDKNSHIYMYGEISRFYADTIKLSLKGVSRDISFKDVSVSSPNIETAKYKVSVTANNLLQSGTLFNGEKISDVIKNNIISDYNSGIQSKKLDIICSNMKDKNGNIIISKEFGEMIKPLNVICSKGDNYPDGSQKYWRIFSREFIYDGEPYLKTISEELKMPVTGGLFNEDGSIIKSWNKMISDGDIVVNGTSVESSNPQNIYGVLIIPSNITDIQSGVFENCKGLIGVSFPDKSNRTGVERWLNIYEGAFYNCSNIQKVNIPSLKGWCFINFKNKTSNPVYYAKSLYVNNELLENIEITHTPTMSDSYNFSSYAFCNCESLKSVSLNYTPDTRYGVVHEYSYSGCKNLQSVVINGVYTISERAFENCDNLSSVKISNDKLRLEIGAFSNCSKITDITLPSNTMEIGFVVFSGCSSLKNVYFAESSAQYKVIDHFYNEYTVSVNNSLTNATNLTTTYVDAEWTKQ